MVFVGCAAFHLFRVLVKLSTMRREVFLVRRAEIVVTDIWEGVRRWGVFPALLNVNQRFSR